MDSLDDLSIGLLHIAKHRGAGFLSQMADEDEASDAKGKQKTRDSYDRITKELKESQQTLGQFFWSRIQDQKAVRRRKSLVDSGIIDYAVPRFLVKKDFHALWDCQAKFYPILTTELKQQVYDLIFKDHPHAPYANALCSLLPGSGEHRLPRMHRLSELRRIYEQVNNLRYQTQQDEHRLTLTMRDTLVEGLLKGETLNKTDIKTILKPMTDEIINRINMDEEREIKGFAHVVAFANFPFWQAMSEAEQDDLIAFIAEPKINSDDRDSCLMDEESFITELCRRCGVTSESDRHRLETAVHKLPKDRANLGLTATTQVLEKLKAEAISNREATDALGYMAEEEKHRAMAGTYDCLPYYGVILSHDVLPIHPWHIKRTAKEEQIGRAANPVVHVTLNQMRKVVNEIVSLYGKPQSIHIELARDFGKSAQQREEMDKKTRIVPRKTKSLTQS